MIRKIRTVTKEELLSEHLSIIREIGRNIGVKSPATKKKHQIIKDILDIQSGAKEPESIERRGAPTKKVDITKYYLYLDDQPYDVKPLPGLEFRSPESCNYADPMPTKKDPFETEGFFDYNKMGFGFLRKSIYATSSEDVYVSSANVKKYKLRQGDMVKCMAEPRTSSAPPLCKLISINGEPYKVFGNRVDFEELVPCYPNEKIKFESSENSDLSLRCIDMFAPVGKGQRGLIVAPPKTGKTTLLKNIAKSIESNYPDIKLIILLIDERPEEVTEFKREIVNAELLYSTFDESAIHHVKTAEHAFARAKGYTEVGKDVVVLVDSITRLTRANNSVVESSGKTLSGGLDPLALHLPKRLFGLARNVENGGSFTVIATALVETGSRMDDVVYEEFKGTGNMEIHLSRELSERRVFPAIDVNKSGTRKDELLLSEEELDCSYKLRRTLAGKIDGVEALLGMMKKTKNNAELVAKTDAWLKMYNK